MKKKKIYAACRVNEEPPSANSLKLWHRRLLTWIFQKSKDVFFFFSFSISLLLHVNQTSPWTDNVQKYTPVAWLTAGYFPSGHFVTITSTKCYWCCLTSSRVVPACIPDATLHTIQTDNPTRSSPPSLLHPSPFSCISMDASLSSALVHNGSSCSQGSGLRGPVTARLISHLKSHRNKEEWGGKNGLLLSLICPVR